MNDFYNELKHVLNTKPNSCIKILIGDFNTKIGKEDIYKSTIGPNSSYDIRNDKETRFIYLCLAQGFH